MPDVDYVELRARSAFSFLDGASLPEDLVARAAALGYDAIALADRNGLYGAPRFFQAAKTAGLRPIVGADVVVENAGTLDACRDEIIDLLEGGREAFEERRRRYGAS